MKQASSARHKQEILSDPVAAFCARHPAADKKDVQALGQLWHQAQTLAQQQAEIRAQTKMLSRKIGEAKRDGKAIDSLMASMKALSSGLRQLQQELADVEDRILDFIEPEPTIPDKREPAATPQLVEASGSRSYSYSSQDPGDISVSELELGEETPEWNKYVRNNPATTIHHRAEWRQLLHRSYGLDSHYFVARDASGKIVGILPLVRLRSRLFGDFMVSMPWFCHGGAVADHPLIEQKLMHTANERAAALQVDHIEYRDDIPREALRAQTHKVNMVLELPGSVDELWRGFSSKLRAQIKRPQREKPQPLVGREELLDDFYEVYTSNMRDLGSPAHSKAFVDNILECFAESSWVMVLRLKGRPVAAGLLLGHGDTLEIPLASTLREVNMLSINMLLYWEVLKFAITRGFRQFDFGRSSRNAGTYRFKRQWGAQPKQLYWHYWLRKPGELPALNPTNPKYTVAINVWKRLPLAATRWLGPWLIRHLP